MGAQIKVSSNHANIRGVRQAERSRSNCPRYKGWSSSCHGRTCRRWRNNYQQRHSPIQRLREISRETENTRSKDNALSRRRMKTGVAGSRLGVGRAKDQFQVASCELQARKTKNEVRGWWLEVGRERKLVLR